MTLKCLVPFDSPENFLMRKFLVLILCVFCVENAFKKQPKTANTRVLLLYQDRASLRNQYLPTSQLVEGSLVIAYVLNCQVVKSWDRAELFDWSKKILAMDLEDNRPEKKIPRKPGLSEGELTSSPLKATLCNVKVKCSR